MTGQNATEVTINYNAEVAKAISNIRKINSTVKKGHVATDQQAKSLGTHMTKVQEFSRKARMSLRSTKIEFQGWALSMLFFGQAMIRIFTSLWKASSATFREVSDSVAESTNGFAMLEGSVKYLQFTLGAALEPVAAWLIPIIDNMATWVDDNQETAASLLVINGVLGSIVLSIGFMTLGIGGFVNGIAKIGPAFLKVQGFIAATSTKFGEFVAKTPVLNTMKTKVFGVEGAFGKVLLTVGGIATGVIVLGLLIGKLFSDNITGMNEMLKKWGWFGSYLRVVGNLWGVVYNLFSGGITSIKIMLSGLFGAVWDWLSGIFPWLDKIGAFFSRIADWTQSANEDTKAWKDSLDDAYQASKGISNPSEGFTDAMSQEQLAVLPTTTDQMSSDDMAMLAEITAASTQSPVVNVTVLIDGEEIANKIMDSKEREE